jgi:hypothetical protein
MSPAAVSKHLFSRTANTTWALDEAEQIQKMKDLYAALPEKPEWIRLKDIEQYEAAMIGVELEADRPPGAPRDVTPLLTPQRIIDAGAFFRPRPSKCLIFDLPFVPCYFFDQDDGRSVVARRTDRNGNMIPQHQTSTGTGSLAGDLLAYMVMIGGGVAFMFWISSISDVERQMFVNRALNIFTFILAQPGVFLSAKIAMRPKISIARRVFWAIAVFLVLACAVPATLSYWIYSALH